MRNHENFLKFNNQNIFFLNSEGVYWIALKPILDALNLPSERYLKKTKRDPFFSTCLDTVSIQVENNGIIQGRKMTCLPEKYIYGWICILNSDNKELNEYKETCYSLIYDHFHGTMTNRKELLVKRISVDARIRQLKEELKEKDIKYQELHNLQQERKRLSGSLNSIDTEIINQTEIQFN